MQEKLSREELANKKLVVSNTALQTIGTTINMITGLFMTGMLARYLGTKGFGELSLALTYFSFAGIIANLGYGTILTRELAKIEPWDGTRASTLLSSVLVLQTASTILAMACLAGYLAFLQCGHAFKIQIFIMGTVHFAILLNSFESIFRARLRMEYAVYAGICYRLSHLALIAGIVYCHGSLTMVVLSYVAANLIYSMLLFLWARKIVIFRFIWDALMIRFLFKETAPLVISSGLWIILYRFNILMLERMKGVEAVAIYNASYRFVDYAYALSSLTMVSIYPLMAGRFPDNITGLNRIYQKSVDYLSIMGGTLSIALLVCAPFIIWAIFGNQYHDAVIVLQIFSLAPFLMFLNNCFGNMLYVLGMQKTPMIVLRLIGLVVNLCANFILIPRYSFLGAAAAIMLTDTVLLAILPFMIRKKLPLLPSMRNLLIGITFVVASIVFTFMTTAWQGHIFFPLLVWAVAVLFFLRYNKDELKATLFLKPVD